jgi:hypothetical protein
MDWLASMGKGLVGVLCVSLGFMTGCGTEGGQETSFTLGWLVLSATVFCMLFLFIGLLRYLRGGISPPDSLPNGDSQFMEYQYGPEDEDED